MLDKLFRRFRSKPDACQPTAGTAQPVVDMPTDPNVALSRLVWRESKENPFNMRLLDCRPFCTTMMSCTSDPAIAERFGESRQSNGEEVRGKLPTNLLTVQAHLTFPHNGNKPNDGALFLAELMEDKWDVFLHDGHLYFCRSWTGKLLFRAKIEFGETEATVTNIDADSEDACGDPDMVIQIVDFLIKSHLYSFKCPHPVPKDMRDADPQKIALWSLSSFGRRGYFATFEDTTTVRIQR